MDKKGHWYTDKNGHHYFVEDGQSPKEGWEASKRRKMIDGGKYKVSEDGDNWEDVDEDTYNKYEADKSDFDENIDDDFGFDEYKDDDGIGDDEEKQEFINQLVKDNYFKEGEIKDIKFNDDDDATIDITTDEGTKRYEYVGGRLYTHESAEEDKDYNEDMKEAQNQNADMRENDDNKGNPYDPEDLPDEGMSQEELDKETTDWSSQLSSDPSLIKKYGWDKNGYADKLKRKFGKLNKTEAIKHEPVDMPKYHSEKDHIVIDEGPNKGDSYDSEQDFRNSTRSGENDKAWKDMSDDEKRDMSIRAKNLRDKLMDEFYKPGGVNEQVMRYVNEHHKLDDEELYNKLQEHFDEAGALDKLVLNHGTRMLGNTMPDEETNRIVENARKIIKKYRG